MAARARAPRGPEDSCGRLAWPRAAAAPRAAFGARRPRAPQGGRRACAAPGLAAHRRHLALQGRQRPGRVGLSTSTRLRGGSSPLLQSQRLLVGCFQHADWNSGETMAQGHGQARAAEGAGESRAPSPPAPPARASLSPNPAPDPARLAPSRPKALRRPCGLPGWEAALA